METDLKSSEPTGAAWGRATARSWLSMLLLRWFRSALSENPNYTFDPDIFPESPEARQLGRKLVLPAGPNNPVGSAWISLDKPGYGIHGAPRPEEVGRTESHGCFRLANWNAEYLIKLVNVGTPVFVEP